MSELAEVVRRRRMTRSFDPRPVAPEVVAQLVDLASRAPSAGKTQGWHLVVLHGPDTERFWRHAFPAERRAGFRFPGLFDAPVIALALADPQAYLDRYSEPDKQRTGWGESLDRWSAPYWTIDAAMAVNTLLLAAEDQGLGALFFAVSNGEAEVRAELGIPEHLQLLGAIALGHPRRDGGPEGVSAGRPRRSPAEIVHDGRWRGAG